MAIGRYSISGEYMLARHHAVTLSPFFTSTSVKVNDKEIGSLSGFGGELGYRFYTGSRGANGFFVGPSVLFASYNSESVVGNTSQSFTAMGGALDIGGQFLIGPGVVIGFGGGLQYTKNSEEIRHRQPQPRERGHRRRRRSSPPAPRGRLLVLRSRPLTAIPCRRHATTPAAKQ